MDRELVEYDVSEWSDDQLETLKFWLLVSQVPVEWRDGRVVVPAADETDMDEMLRSIEDGVPDPRPAGIEPRPLAPIAPLAARTPELAGPGRRIVGALIDGAIVGIPRMFVYAYVADTAFLVALFFAIDAAYTIGLTARFGQTVGKRIVDTEVVSIEGVTPPGLRVAVIRYAVVIAGFPLVWFLGDVGDWLSLAWMVAVYVPIFGRQRRGLHDRIAGTDVYIREYARSLTAHRRGRRAS